MPKRDRFATLPAGTSQQTFSLASILGSDAAGVASDERPMHSVVDHISTDGRRSRTTKVSLGPPPSPVKAARAKQRQELSQTSQPALQAPSEAVLPDSELSPPAEFRKLEHESYNMVLWLDGDELQNPATELPPPAPGSQQGQGQGASRSDPALSSWAENDRDDFLDMLLWNDGRGSFRNMSTCPQCGKTSSATSPVIYRCRDCFSGEMTCKACCVAAHAETPLHWVEFWNGKYFKRSSLKALGLRIQFGHAPRERCSAPRAGHSEFVIIHTNGIHTVAVDFCGCHRRKDADYIQLLRRRWFPATSDQPQTCATFACLDSMHSFALEAKITPRGYYDGLVILTDGSGSKPPDRYKAVLRMLRAYWHLLALKRAGRGHEPGGVKATRHGQLAILCPACPRPGINLPADWRSAPSNKQCIYTLFLAMDACFHLKRGMVSSWLKDPGLGTGLAYFVEWIPYRDFLLTITDQQEMSTCSGLAALDHANTKFSRGYSTTGVGMCVCARHEFVLPNAVGDLQKGKRYGNMDYVLASALRHVLSELHKVISYDIACQWWKELRERLAKLPALVRLHIVLGMFRFVIPKMHIKGHTLLCQLIFSLYLAVGGGQTDGEGIERLWSLINGLGRSTRMCGPGARADQLDDFWSYSNWRKLVGLAAILRRRLDTAHEELCKQTEAFEELTKQQQERVPIWEKMVRDFEAPRVEGQPEPENPYEGKLKGKTEREVRKEFEEDEAKEALAGVPTIHEVTPSAFVAYGLELEELQRRTRVQAELKKAKSTASKINLGNMRRKIDQMLVKFRALQATYCPAALVRLQRKEHALKPDVVPEDIPLVMPSALSIKECETGCSPGITDIEVALRQAQCREALVALRNQLHIKARLLLYKKNSSRHQAMNTRSRTLINRNESKVKLQAEKYQGAWRALRSLLGVEYSEFQRLRAEDVRCMEDAETVDQKLAKEARRLKAQSKLVAMGELPLVDTSEERLRAEDAGDSDEEVSNLGKGQQDNEKRGEGKRIMSWIWNTTRVNGSEAELEEAMRVEWCKALARSRRWSEETFVAAINIHQKYLYLARVNALWLSSSGSRHVPARWDPSRLFRYFVVAAINVQHIFTDDHALIFIDFAERPSSRSTRAAPLRVVTAIGTSFEFCGTAFIKSALVPREDRRRDLIQILRNGFVKSTCAALRRHCLQDRSGLHSNFAERLAASPRRQRFRCAESW
ncbi:CxC2 domain-containing protein [Mycena chlorophos]|uniref:CxC2 domain-containing protein n=1 Tax=Mycena chlorophos TaxID=658473 RepID=A0A8H6SVG4_MYCCL|nr:CxC2 domain-containing protein [Mycena chlorophos]